MTPSGLQNGSPGRDEVAVTKAWLDRALAARAFSLHSCVAWFDEQRTELLPLSFTAASWIEAAGWRRLLPELSVFTAALSGSTSVGPNCSHSPLLRRPAVEAAGWGRFFSAALPARRALD